MFGKYLVLPVLTVIMSMIYVLFPWNSSSNAQFKDLLTLEELKSYNGVDRSELYLCILGQIFDVTEGKRHYGPGATYNFFIGKDASRSFITGDFDERNVKDGVADLTTEELKSLSQWVKFYHKHYRRVGKLIGTYYSQDGKLTPYGEEVRKLILAAEKHNAAKEYEKNKYPPCNMEWDAVKGSRVWCTNRSGGITREWSGVPRQLYEPGSKEFRCACVKLGDDLNVKNFKQYRGCDNESDSCNVND